MVHVPITLHYATDIKQSNDSELDIKDNMNIAFLCDADDAPYLQCTLVLISVYSDVIMRATGDNNNRAASEINSCHTRSEHLNHEKIITRNFSINSTCLSGNNISSMLINVTIFYAIIFL